MKDRKKQESQKRKQKNNELLKKKIKTINATCRQKLKSEHLCKQKFFQLLINAFDKLKIKLAQIIRRKQETNKMKLKHIN